jgi:hypothetical protein
MSLLAEAKTLVSERYPLVFAVTLLGVTALIQSPRLAEFGSLAQEASMNRDKSIKSRSTQASMADIAVWGRNVPSANMAESSQFLVTLEEIAMNTRCDLGNTSDAPVKAVENADSLDMIEANVEVFGSYDAILAMLKKVREDSRVLAVTRASVTPVEYPRLRAELTLRRYVRHTGLAAAAKS